MAENINDGEATDHLRPEVREAVEYCAEVFDASDNGEWATVRAELERQAAEIAELRKERRKLRKVCAAAYQAAGAYSLPVRFLDALFDAAQGDIEARQKTDALLPCETPDFVLERDELRAEIAELRAKSADRDSHDLTECMREMCVELADAGVIPPGFAPMFVVDAVLALKTERDELRAKLDNPGTTHSEGCWTWGPKHYGCAENRIQELEAELAAMRAEWDAE
ncbi:fructose-2,6-bisphosphatase [Mizugakiibacter sediminis]|uniref:Fructose-2,6-bisphosphatase n=1 Tax=Mizugakiibacter sediminis TaxID=1475481 RepID=A0A0K8QRS7_9GAMM|nr:hypothetical protein [Mizugakiibacter sediminis]GAP67366.1 fructose-2,6-bisphosphatase [Mizugakiibacter sediminis]